MHLTSRFEERPTEAGLSRTPSPHLTVEGLVSGDDLLKLHYASSRKGIQCEFPSCCTQPLSSRFCFSILGIEATYEVMMATSSTLQRSIGGLGRHINHESPHLNLGIFKQTIFAVLDRHSP